MFDNLIDADNAAIMSGLTKVYIRKLCQRGTLRAKKFGNVWVIDRNSLTEYLSIEHKPGPKSIDK